MYVYDICPNTSCSVVYRADIREAKACPICMGPRYDDAGKALKRMQYMSIRGYVQYLCSNESFVRAMGWWNSEQRFATRQPGTYTCTIGMHAYDHWRS